MITSLFAVNDFCSTQNSIPYKLCWCRRFSIWFSFAIILHLLHFCVFDCVLEFVRLNFPDPYLMKTNLSEEKKKKVKKKMKTKMKMKNTIYSLAHFHQSCRILHTQIELYLKRYSTFSIYSVWFMFSNANGLNNNTISSENKRNSISETTVSLVKFSVFGKRLTRGRLIYVANIIEYIYYIFVLCVEYVFPLFMPQPNPQP